MLILCGVLAYHILLESQSSGSTAKYGTLRPQKKKKKKRRAFIQGERLLKSKPLP